MGCSVGFGGHSVALMMGAPGAGKGTQASDLARLLNLPHIATGDLLREHRRRRTVLGLTALQYMDQGDLVPGDLVVRMVIDRLDRADAANGALLDGFPRTLPQARALDAELGTRAGGVRAVLYLDVPVSTLVSRMTGRRVCIGCQSTFHVDLTPLPLDGTCPRCSDLLVQRPDDTPAIVEHRIGVYLQETAPVLDHYALLRLVYRVDGDRPIDEIRADLLDVLRASYPAPVAS